MSKAKTFEYRVEEAKEFERLGELRKAISTLSKAIYKEPEKDTDGKVKTWIDELELKFESVEKKEDKTEDEPEEVIPEKLSDDEIVEFIVTAPFLRGAVAYEVGHKIKLPRENDFIHVKEI